MPRMPSYKDILPGAFNTLDRRVQTDRADTSALKRAATRQESAMHDFGQGISDLGAGVSKYGAKLDAIAEKEKRKRGGGSGGGGSRGSIGSRVAYDTWDQFQWEDNKVVEDQLFKDDDDVVLGEGYKQSVLDGADERGGEWWKTDIDAVDYRSSIKETINSQVLGRNRDLSDRIDKEIDTRRDKRFGETQAERLGGRYHESIVKGTMTPETALQAEFARIDEQDFGSVVSDKHKSTAAVSITRSALSKLPYDQQIALLNRLPGERKGEFTALSLLTPDQRKELVTKIEGDQKDDAGELVPKIDTAINGLKQGINLSPDTKATIDARVLRNNDPEVRKKYAELRVYSDIRERFDGMPMAERKQMPILMLAEAQRRKDGSPETQAKIDAAKEVNAADEAAIKEDNIGYAETHLGLTVVFANPSDADEMAEALSIRVAEGPRIGEAMNSPLGLIKPGESAAAVESFAVGKWDFLPAIARGAAGRAHEVYRDISQHTKTDAGFAIPFAGNLARIHGQDAPIIQEVQAGVALVARAKANKEEKKSLVLAYGDGTKAERESVTERTTWRKDATGNIYLGEKDRGLGLLTDGLHEYRVSKNLTANDEASYKQAARDVAGVRTIGGTEYGGFVGLESHLTIKAGSEVGDYFGLAARFPVTPAQMLARAIGTGSELHARDNISPYSPFGSGRGSIQAPSNMKTAALPYALSSIDINNLPGGVPLDNDGDPMSQQSFREATYRPAGPPGRYHIYDEDDQPWLSGSGARSKVVIDIRENSALQELIKADRPGDFL